MDINTIVLIIILAVILYAMVTNNQSKSKKAEELREQIIAEKETISKEEVATYGQVQERKNQLIKVIDSSLSAHPEESNQLKGIVDEWANLKVESFENRRSWVRASKKEK
tara:strand:+ start:161 stop:490 length:330 start_codon:yes stop_codon:yes gene_type:complete